MRSGSSWPSTGQPLGCVEVVAASRRPADGLDIWLPFFCLFSRWLSLLRLVGSATSAEPIPMSVALAIMAAQGPVCQIHGFPITGRSIPAVVEHGRMLCGNERDVRALCGTRLAAANTPTSRFCGRAALFLTHTRLHVFRFPQIHMEPSRIGASLRRQLLYPLFTTGLGTWTRAYSRRAAMSLGGSQGTRPSGRWTGDGERGMHAAYSTPRYV